MRRDFGQQTLWCLVSIHLKSRAHHSCVLLVLDLLELARLLVQLALVALCSEAEVVVAAVEADPVLLGEQDVAELVHDLTIFVQFEVGVLDLLRELNALLLLSFPSGKEFFEFLFFFAGDLDFLLGFFLLCGGEHVVWAAYGITKALWLLASVAFFSSLEVVILTFAALPSSVWKLEVGGHLSFLVLPASLLLGLGHERCGFSAELGLSEELEGLRGVVEVTVAKSVVLLDFRCLEIHILLAEDAVHIFFAVLSQVRDGQVLDAALERVVGWSAVLVVGIDGIHEVVAHEGARGLHGERVEGLNGLFIRVEFLNL